MHHILLLLPLIAGCAERRLARQEQKEEVRLSETARAWWDAMRWEQAEAASLAIEHLDERQQFLETWMSGSPFRIVDARILGTEVGETQEGGPSDPLRVGRVLVRVEGYDASQVTQVRTLTQTWYRTRTGWYLDLGEENSLPTAPPPR